MPVPAARMPDGAVLPWFIQAELSNYFVYQRYPPDAYGKFYRMIIKHAKNHNLIQV